MVGIVGILGNRIWPGGEISAGFRGISDRAAIGDRVTVHGMSVGKKRKKSLLVVVLFCLFVVAAKTQPNLFANFFFPSHPPIW